MKKSKSTPTPTQAVESSKAGITTEEALAQKKYYQLSSLQEKGSEWRLFYTKKLSLTEFQVGYWNQDKNNQVAIEATELAANQRFHQLLKEFTGQ